MADAIFDSHLHVIQPGFPLVANEGYIPAHFGAEDYLARARPLGITGGAVVSGSFQGTDQDHLVAALERLGPGFVGVAQLPEDVDDETILALDRAGVRAARVNLRRRGLELLATLESLARRVHDLAGWHVEIYADGPTLLAVEDRLAALPQVCIDHLGHDAAGLPAVLRLVERGAKVKASGFGRVDLDVPEALRAIAAIDPGALLFGTDLPSTRAPRPFADSDVQLVRDVLGVHARAALRENAVAFYRPRET